MVLKSSDGYSDINNSLAVGKADTHGGPTMKQLKQEHKIDVVIDLNAKKSEAKEAERAGLKWVGKKVLTLVPPAETLESISKSINAEVEAGRKVYVHCHRGIYRAPTIAAAYLIYGGMTTDAAIKRIKSRRPSALPGIEDSQKLLPALRLFEGRIRNSTRGSTGEVTR